MAWICELNYEQVVRLHSRNPQFYHAILRGMEREILYSIRCKTLAEYCDIHILGKELKNEWIMQDILISYDDGSVRVITGYDYRNYHPVNAGNIIVLHPKSGIMNTEAICVFLNSKYGLLQMREILCRKIIDTQHLQDILIPIFPSYLEEKIDSIAMEAYKNPENSARLLAYSVRLMEKFIEKQAKVR